MLVKGFGINADAGWLDGDLALLEKDLAYYAEAGFTHVEIPVHGVGAVCNGVLLRERVRELCRLLACFPLKYTVHSPNPLNLMNLDDRETEHRLLISSIEFARLIGAGILVCHSGRYRPEESFGLPRQPMSLRAEEKMWQAEVEALQEMSRLAADAGVLLGMENARPYLDGSPYCYAERPEELVKLIRAVDRQNVGITLDLGHAYLASRFYGFDFLRAVRAAAPYVRHLHIHDNFGKVIASYEKKQPELAAKGRGDLHLPPGWGEIPLRDVFRLLDNYEGVLTMELRPRYRQYAGEALAALRDLCANVPVDNI